MTKKDFIKIEFDYEEDSYDKLHDLEENHRDKFFTNKANMRKPEFDYEEDPYEPEYDDFDE